MSEENTKQNKTEPSPAPAPESVEQAIQRKIHFWLSRENLQTDAFLVSNMNSEMWVEIDVLTKFNGLKLLSADAALVARVMRGSDKVHVSEDGRLIRPNFKLERKTLIIRDIPSSTDVKEVEAIFSHLSDDSKPTEIKSEVGDNWFVSFASEEKCVNAHMSLLGKKFRDQPIRARVKSETLLKGIYQPVAVPAPYGYVYTSTDGQVGYQYGVPPNGAYMNPPRTPRGSGNNKGVRQRDGATTRPEGKGQPKKSQQPQLAKKPRKPVPVTPIHPAPQLGITNFPPLPAKKDLQEKGHGYSHGFKQISSTQMYEILKAMDSLSKPTFVTDCGLVRDDLDKPQGAPKQLTSDESAEVFVQVDQTPDARGMSPFISPFFASVPSGDWPNEVSLTPPAALKGSHSRAVAIEAPASPMAKENRTDAPSTPKDDKSSSFRDVLLSPAKQVAPQSPPQQSQDRNQSEVKAP